MDVRLVRLELLATDSSGREVEGLARTDLRLEVDGKPVALEGFEPPPPPLPDVPRALRDLPQGQTRVPSAPDARGPAATAPPAARHYLAILADETSSEQANRLATYGGLFAFLEEPLPPDLLVAILRFDGSLRVVCPWTSDRELLRRGAAALQKRRVVARIGGPGNITNSVEGAPNRPDFDTMEAIGHAKNSLTALFDSLREFPEAPGRKSLYFITDGSPFLTPSDISRDVIATSASDATAAGGPDAERRARLETDRDNTLLLDALSWDRTRSGSLLVEVTRLALLRGIEIHPVRSAAHDLGGNVSAARGFHDRATAGMGRSLDRRSQRSATVVPTTDIAAGQEMETVAETSGGAAVLSRRFFQDDLRREAQRRPYLLSFQDPFGGDHRFHTISISVARPGVVLRYRKGYRILDVRESLIQASVNRMHVPADENPLGVRLQLDPVGRESGAVVAEIRAAYPAPPEAGGTAPGAGSMRVVGVCGVRDRALSEPIDLSGPAELVRFGDATWLFRSGKVRVKPGAYRWSFAIRDEQTGITSYLTFDRAVP